MPGSGVHRPCGEHSSPHAPLPPGHPAGGTEESDENLRAERVPKVWCSNHQIGPSSATNPWDGQGSRAGGRYCSRDLKKGGHPGDGGPEQLSLGLQVSDVSTYSIDN